jgi:hypothetical protein
VRRGTHCDPLGGVHCRQIIQPVCQYCQYPRRHGGLPFGQKPPRIDVWVHSEPITARLDRPPPVTTPTRPRGARLPAMPASTSFDVSRSLISIWVDSRSSALTSRSATSLSSASLSAHLKALLRPAPLPRMRPCHSSPLYLDAPTFLFSASLLIDSCFNCRSLLSLLDD